MRRTATKADVAEDMPKPSRIEAEEAVKTLIRWAGDDPDRKELSKTPARVVRAYEEWFAGYKETAESHMGAFKPTHGYKEIIYLRDIAFESHCEHHMAPIIGKAHVGYLPGSQVIGISKIVRLVKMFSQRLQSQEKLTEQIADCLNDALAPRGVGVVIEAIHACMTTRGVHQADLSMVTSSLRGMFQTHARFRQEFLSGIRLRSAS